MKVTDGALRCRISHRRRSQHRNGWSVVGRAVGGGGGAFPPKLLSRQNDPAALLSRQYGASSFLHVSGPLLAPALRAASAATIMKDIAKVTTEGVNSTSG